MLHTYKRSKVEVLTNIFESVMKVILQEIPSTMSYYSNNHLRI